jgi:Zn-finger nucleic acid-binding protein
MKNETKRPGESPEFDEHANEDGYFANKEHELIEDMRLKFQKAKEARREAEMATCPKCSGKFQKYPLLGCVVERCENCEGIWLNKGELDAILHQQARGPLAVFLDRCFAKTEPLKSNQKR